MTPHELRPLLIHLREQVPSKAAPLPDGVTRIMLRAACVRAGWTGIPTSARRSSLGGCLLRYLWVDHDPHAASLFERFGAIPGYAHIDDQGECSDPDPTRAAYGSVAAVIESEFRALRQYRHTTPWRWAGAMLIELADVIAGRRGERASMTWRSAMVGQRYTEWRDNNDETYQRVFERCVQQEAIAAERAAMFVDSGAVELAP